MKGRNRDADERVDLWTQQGKERMEGLERVALAYTLPRVTQTASEKLLGLPWWPSSAESAFQCRRVAFAPWVGEVP